MTTTNSMLEPVLQRGWLRGFGNLFRTENNLRWGRNRWILSALIWLVLLNGLIFLVSYGEGDDGRLSREEIATEGISIFINFCTIATAVGVIVGVQGAIIREKQLGTAAWVLSKPVSRNSFVLAKMLSSSFFYLILPLLLTSLAFFAQSRILWQQIPNPTAFFMGWLIMVLHTLFYVAFTLMLGTLFSARGPVSAIGLGFLFGGQLLPNFLPAWATTIFPWSLAELASGLALKQSMPSGWFIPVIASVIWIIVFIAVALWRFGREEF